MKRILATVICVLCAAALTVQAQDAKPKKQGNRPPMTEEQKAFQKQMVEKYDANKDGKLDREERTKMSQEDKDQWTKLFPRGKKGEKKAE